MPSSRRAIRLSSLVPRVLGWASADSPWDDGELLRAELFSIERLEQHAASLAAAQQVTRRRTARRSLSVRLRDNESALLAAYRAIVAAVAEGRAITPAAEWLIDNYHLVEDQIREVRQDLPPAFYRLLPKLASGPFNGYPRVFGLAWAFVAHTDSRFDPETLRQFVRAYQRVQPLTIGELWAVAITLRIVLVENLRRAATRIVSSRAARQEADAVADRLLGVDGYPAEPDALVRSHARHAALAPAFVVQLIHRLRDQDPRATPALRWLQERLAAQGTTSEAIVHDEHQRQGASNVTVRNIITSMRLLSDVDWREFFESVSLVDEALRAGSDFGAMDFPSRDLYRRAIEQLARGSNRTELEIAQAALSAAGKAVAGRELDPGYYLIAAGRRRPVKSADDGSRAHTSHDARGAGSAAREPRGSLPGVARRRALLRAAFGLDRRPQRERRGGRGAARHCGGRHRAPEPSSRHGRCRRSLPAAASSPGLERRAETVDGMGTQARQAPGIEPAAARRDRHDLPASRGATACRSARRALCHHAGRRHPVAARNGAAARRQDGPPAEPAEVRRRKRRRPRGIRRSAAAGCAVAAGRSRGVAVSARLFEREWHRSVLSCSVRRLPGSVQ